jgi:ubiquinone/menaquinone biosynthesis C-methylase UbiE
MITFEWLEQLLKPTVCNSVEFMYDNMESQSGYCLPLIYQPFDSNNRAHWRDRGACFDYLYSTRGEGKQLLDFGPGDGWPSLIVAPFAGKIVGVDGSRRRAQVCNDNARRLGIKNVTFLHIEPGSKLPFKDNSFDGVMAASSIEQTPNPKSTLNELFRILRPDGRLRIHYENLAYYADGKEQEVHLDEISDRASVITLYDRHIEKEHARMYKIFVSLNTDSIKKHFQIKDENFSATMITKEQLMDIRSAITESRMCHLYHPSGKTFIFFLVDIGFAQVAPTHDGAQAAAQLFDEISEQNRPHELIKPVVATVIQKPAPLGNQKTWDPMITAVK